MNRRLAAALSGAAMALALAGCGDDNSKELDAWSKTVCDSVEPQVERAQKALSDTAVVKEGEKPSDLRTRLSGDIDALAQSNAQLAKDIEAAGAPPVDDGQKLQKDAVGELRASAKAYGNLKKQVDGLDTKDRSKFAEGLTGVGEEIEKLRKRNNESLEKLQTGDVGRSMARQKGCKPGSSSPTAPGTPSGSPSATSGSTEQPAPAPSKSRA